ncbi:carboxymuconolactone decarboxylase family protein [Segniliparus rugosus]|uniref:Carboxymuconolactone decarboxylase-like domain-containing protein n=1 Tax=Segniliparus rugosus (strain ATCC BAA-974 / DSM 45345 / CCUG 50838 / CIP 108380 / JCM 13579 / CDC 945) TaxID=679197 RepID=E5XLL5_SEGRC|nr:carboxymuconolactone decarboxylase family protein [Segniliparus rugosus]EFV14788.1 hypothetical protein HMPREF9336_00384 [Segniliparus rugosus ATCC BAA-974]
MPAPPDLDSLTPAQRAVYDRFPANLMRYMVLAEASAQPYLDLGMSFRRASLPPKDRESVILRVGGLLDNAYEAMQHKEIARSVGVDDSDIEKLLAKSVDFEDPRLARLIAYVDAAVANAVTPSVVAALADDHDDRQIAEIALLVGHYVMTSIFLKSFEIPLDAEPTPWGDIPQ